MLMMNQTLNVLLGQVADIQQSAVQNPATANLDMNNFDITNADEITCSTLNYTTLNPPVIGGSQTLAQTLALGNSAGIYDVDMSNNDILNTASVQNTSNLQLISTAGAVQVFNNTTPLLTVTDGITINTISQNGYTTRHTNGNTTHYLTFVDTSTTGVGPIQKTNGISCNPHTNILTATSFSGNLSGTASNSTAIDLTNDNSSGSFFIPFSKTSLTNNNVLYFNGLSNTLTYNPSSGDLQTTTFSGSLNGNANTASTAAACSGNSLTATTATTTVGVNLTSDNTAGTYYLPFSKTVTATDNVLYIDNVTGPLSYNASSSTLSATNFSGLASNSSNILITSDNTAGTYYIPFAKTTGTGQKPLFIDDTVGTPLNYNPSTGVMNVPGVIGTIQLPTTITAATFTSGTTLNINMGAFRTFNNFQIGFSGTTNTVSVFSFSGAVANGIYYVAIHNGGSGNLTINATGFAANYLTTYTSPIIVPTLTKAIMMINYITYTTGGAIYVVSVDLVA
jgi:hypothetical protein